jgi:hypothetical protein
VEGSSEVRSELIDIEVTSLDGETLIELSNVRTVKLPISEACIAKKGDVRNWSHLRDLPLQELETGEVMLVIGLQENPSIFLPLEYRSGEERDPVAIRYSLGWTVIGPVGGKGDGMCATSNFARMSVNADDLSTEDRTFESLKEAREFLTEDRAMEESEHVMGYANLGYANLAWQIGRPCFLFLVCLAVEPNCSKRTSTGLLYILTFVSNIC